MPISVFMTLGTQGRKESCQSLRQVGLLDVRLSLAIALSTIQVTVRFNSVPPKHLEREHPRGQDLPPLFPFQHLTRRLATQRVFRVPHAAKALQIYKHPCLLRDSNAGPTAQ
ncbi:hypothetical protein TNCV_164521 [Trichonephila clavipes]|nr:hypothetical protein TNCV_164521 [Trichonephila clavipes]